MASPGGLYAALLAVLLSGCSALPTPLETRVVDGASFQHVVMARRAAPHGEVVHLYIDGDGRPFVDRNTVAADPTPRSSQVLRWMLKDPAEAYYLGRPCYLGLSAATACDYRLWTTERYSERVVESMVTAAENLLQGRPVILIGYSGGGTIALHMAGRMQQVKGLVTVGANLDTDAWTLHHGYSPLTSPGVPGSMLEKLRDLPQLHFMGGRDTIVPVGLAAPLLARTRPGRFCAVAGYSHDCCWTQHWPRFLAALDSWSCAAAGGVAIE